VVDEDWFVVLGVDHVGVDGVSIEVMPCRGGRGGAPVRLRLLPDSEPLSAPGLAQLLLDGGAALADACHAVHPARPRRGGRLTLTAGAAGPADVVVGAADAARSAPGGWPHHLWPLAWAGAGSDCDFVIPGIDLGRQSLPSARGG
jgi:hypothetical protein